MHTIGVDAHKQVKMAVAIDATGRAKNSRARAAVFLIKFRFKFSDVHPFCSTFQIMNLA